MESANNAIHGVVISFKNERSLRIHFLAAVLVLLTGLWLQISRLNLVLLLLAITFIIMAELMNTSIEVLINAFVNKEDPNAKHAKDAAAGGVLIAVVGAVSIGYLVFFDKIRFYAPTIVDRLKMNPVHVTVIALIIVMLLSIVLKTFSKHGAPLRGGMPSGHAALAFATATVIFWFAKNLLIVSSAFLLAAIVAHSRVETKAHGWWEVTLGGLLGFLTMLAVLQGFLR